MWIFIALANTFPVKEVARLFISEVVRLHGFSLLWSLTEAGYSTANERAVMVQKEKENQTEMNCLCFILNPTELSSLGSYISKPKRF